MLALPALFSYALVNVLHSSFIVHGKAAADTWNECAVQKAWAEPRGGTQKQAAAQGVCGMSGRRGRACTCSKPVLCMQSIWLGQTWSNDVRAFPWQQVMHGNVVKAALSETSHDSRCRRHAAEVGQQMPMPCTLHCIVSLKSCWHQSLSLTWLADRLGWCFR